MEIKYTTDGRKVVVIGNLNSQEKIVQEVFIVNGNEVPQGENFVVKSLLDSPMLSWKEKHVKEVESTYDSRIKELEETLRRERAKLNISIEKVKSKAEFMYGLSQNLDLSQIKMLIDFITGDIQWVVYGCSYYGYEYCKFEDIPDKDITYDNKIKLISLFGSSKGDLTYRIHQYTDSSGSYSTNSELFICKTKDEAFEKMTSLNVALPINDEILKKSKKYNFKLDKEKFDAFKAIRIKSFDNMISKNLESIDKYMTDLEIIENLEN